jgi:preprotein translocase subunit SecD
MKFRTLVICALIAVFLAGVFLQAQGAIEIRAASSTAVAGWQRVTADDGEALWVAPTTSLTSADFAPSVSHTMRDGRDAVGVVFTAEGARKMRALSAAQTNQRIALLLDGKVMWAPVVRSTIDSEAQLTGLSPDQAQRLVAALQRR